MAKTVRKEIFWDDITRYYEKFFSRTVPINTGTFDLITQACLVGVISERISSMVTLMARGQAKDNAELCRALAYFAGFLLHFSSPDGRNDVDLMQEHSNGIGTSVQCYGSLVQSLLMPNLTPEEQAAYLGGDPRPPQSKE